MSFFIIPITALLASILTFFSGFGLGTILLPVFAIYYPAPIAVLLTAIVHFSNNIFKIGLVYKNINWNLVLKFGLPSMIAALLGAYFLKNLFNNPNLLSVYEIGGYSFSITLANIACISSPKWLSSLAMSQYILLFSFLMGILFGTIPSYQASKLKPVDALRG